MERNYYWWVMVGELVEEFGERFFGGVGICKSKNV